MRDQRPVWIVFGGPLVCDADGFGAGFVVVAGAAVSTGFVSVGFGVVGAWPCAVRVPGAGVLVVAVTGVVATLALGCALGAVTEAVTAADADSTTGADVEAAGTGGGDATFLCVSE